jgi:hypothetical protein
VYVKGPARQICVRGQWLVDVQRQRPLRPSELPQWVTEVDSQLNPDAQSVLQPPQWFSLVAMSTHLPVQHRSEARLPQSAPFRRAGNEHFPDEQVPFKQGLDVEHEGPGLQLPWASQVSGLVQAFPSEHELPEDFSA